MTGLRWQDVDFGAGVIRVRQSAKEVPGPGGKGTVIVLEGLKNEHSRRTLDLAEAVAPVLRAHRTAQAEARLAMPPAIYPDNDLVFASTTGQPMRRCTVRSAFGQVLKKAGLPHFQLRETRHSFVSVLSDQGESIEA